MTGLQNYYIPYYNFSFTNKDQFAENTLRILINNNNTLIYIYAIFYILFAGLITMFIFILIFILASTNKFFK